MGSIQKFFGVLTPETIKSLSASIGSNLDQLETVKGHLNKQTMLESALPLSKGYHVSIADRRPGLFDGLAKIITASSSEAYTIKFDLEAYIEQEGRSLR